MHIKTGYMRFFFKSLLPKSFVLIDLAVAAFWKSATSVNKNEVFYFLFNHNLAPYE